MKYDEHSITVLPGLQGVRKRPAMYIGDTSSLGLHHLVWEVLDNSVDEAMAGHCSEIRLVFYNDGSVEVADNGRGVPTKAHPTEKIPTVDVVFTMLHAGGKFDSNLYKTSGGLHGVGAAVVNALSKRMQVTVQRGKTQWYREYVNAVPTNKRLRQSSAKRKRSGTCVRFWPDESIFKRAAFDKLTVQRRLRELAFLNAGVKFTLEWESEGTCDEYHSNDGLLGYVRYLAKKRKFVHEPVVFSGDVEGCQVDMVFAYDDQYDSRIHTFANNIATHEGGVHYNAALDAICKVVEEKAERQMKKMGLKVNKSDVIEGLSLIVNVRVPEPQFGGQTKTKLNNDELRAPLGEWMQAQMLKRMRRDRALSDILVSKIVDAAKARDAARKAKATQRKKSSVIMGALAGKLKDCTSKDPELCELYVVEGDSAGGTAVGARDRHYQAILPLKGKPLNVQDKSLGVALGNAEIKAIVAVLGITIGPRGEIFTDDLRYHKIVIMADADPDGGHIACLLLTLFHKHMRALIEEGHVYLWDGPLYRVKHKGRSRYLKDDGALQEYKRQYGEAGLEVSRFKGLGEMDVEELEETAMNPASRTIVQVAIDDEVEATEVIERLMGGDSGARKEFLTKHLRFEESDA